VGRFIAANQLVVVIGAVLQMIAASKSDGRPLSLRRVDECLLNWSLPLNVGLMGLFFFLGHTARAKETAEGIGFPVGNPFQTEVAFANLAFGVLGLLSARFRGLFWFATAVGHAIFMLGAAAVHTREMVKEKNFEPGNAGAVFYYDILAPLVHLGLLSVYAQAEPRRRQTRLLRRG
jgi:hypothetical protein